MGYRRPDNVYVLTFVGTDLDGLEVKVRSTSLRKIRNIAQLKDSAGDNIAALESMCEQFAECLVAWNLEDEDGAPVPATLDSVMDQDAGFILRLVLEWIEAVMGVPDPLSRPSNAGKRSAEGFLPMEAL